MTYRLIEPKSLSGAIGAEVRGVDLAHASDDVWDEIRALFLDRIALFFPGQTLGPKALASVAEHIGPVGEYPFVEGFAEEPRVFAVVKESHETKNFGEGWHSDTTYTDIPPKATVLYSVETPRAGGDTLFANMHLAYEGLSEGLKTMLSGLRAVHSSTVRKGGGRAAGNAYQSVKLVAKNRPVLEATHPLVRTHPETGRKALYVDALHTARIEGWSEAESKALLEYLYQQQQRPELTCRYEWEPGVFAVWDNCAAQHLAVNDYHGYRREMHRLSIAGERPV
ncbi:MAG: taurine dioxygenase [Rhodospirillaceae bacterium]|jgi:taurine dioxygenase|nr:taurine dioxygenase [Rhodospirillaceae bacterium]MBT5810090.1 taurine dioxygenase [Rhodospirillaceae bacterium]